MLLVVLFVGVSLVSASKESCGGFPRRCAPEPPEQTRPHFWIGAAPMCNVKPEDCGLYGFDYDMSHPRGPPTEKSWCFANNRIRCVAPVATPLADPSPSNELFVLSYNIFERDFYISHDGQRERTCRIPGWLFKNYPDVDVIVFQEGFMGGCFHNQKTGTLRAMLDQHGFIHHVDQVRSPTKPQPGGIFIASRWPIVEQDQMVFKANDLSWDLAAAKGVSYTKIIKSVAGTSQAYNIMGTHLIYDSKSLETRPKQVQEWKEFADKKNFPAVEPVIFTGDFNEDLWAHPERLSNLFEILDANMNTPIYGRVNYTSENIYNDIHQLVYPDETNNWIDHIGYSRRHLQPVLATQEAVLAFAEEKFPVCWCEECKKIFSGYIRYDDGKRCPEVQEVRHLSDHNPMVGKFVF